MIDMLARVQRMCETSGSGSGVTKKYDSSSDADLDRRLSSCCFRFASSNRSSQALPYELVCKIHYSVSRATCFFATPKQGFEFCHYARINQRQEVRETNEELY